MLRWLLFFKRRRRTALLPPLGPYRWAAPRPPEPGLSVLGWLQAFLRTLRPTSTTTAIFAGIVIGLGILGVGRPSEGFSARPPASVPQEPAPRPVGAPMGVLLWCHAEDDADLHCVVLGVATEEKPRTPPPSVCR